MSTTDEDRDSALAALVAAYAVARAETAATADDSLVTSERITICRYCRKRWDRMPGTKLDGHALCIVTPAFRELVLDFQRRHWRVSCAALASKLGVTTTVLKAWTHSRSGGWLGAK